MTAETTPTWEELRAENERLRGRYVDKVRRRDIEATHQASAGGRK